MKNVISLQPFYLAQPLGATDVTMQVRGLKDSRGNAITAMPSGVTELTITIEPRSTTNQEFVSGTGITDNGNGLVTITGLTRNLSPVDGSADLSDTVSHANNSECVVSNSPFSMRNVLTTNEDKTVTATISFGASPTVPVGVNPTDVVNKSQLDATVAGTVPFASTTVLGSVRVATDPTKTLGTATMTIASPCVVTLNSHALTANDTIRFTTTGALPTGLVVGTTYYVLSTGLTVNTFQLSLTSGGTSVVTTGSQSGTHTLYRTTPYTVNDQDTRLPTQGENDAMVGTSGTPSSSNKFVTDADTSTTLSGTKVIRANSGLYPAGDGSAITGIGTKLNIVTTDVNIANTTTETTILSYSVTGGVLSTNNAVRVTLHVSSLVTGQASGTDAFTFRFKYGATTLVTFTLTPTAATNYMGKIEFILAGAGTTSSQNGSLVSNLGEPTYVGNANTRRMYFTDSSQGTSAIDSTTAQTLAVTGQYGSANASNIANISMIVVEKIS